MLVRIANSKDPAQTGVLQMQSDLGLGCLSIPF